MTKQPKPKLNVANFRVFDGYYWTKTVVRLSCGFQNASTKTR